MLSPEQDKAGTATHTEAALVQKSTMNSDALRVSPLLADRSQGAELVLKNSRRQREEQNIDELIEEEFKIAEEGPQAIKSSVIGGGKQVKFDPDDMRYVDTASKFRSPDEQFDNHDEMPDV